MCVINSVLVSTKRSVSLPGEPARYIWYLVPGTQVPRYKHQVPRYLRGVCLYLESLPEARDGGGESSLMRDEYLLEKLGCHLNTKRKWCVIICAQ